MAATFTIFIVLLSLATRLFVSRRQGRRLATWDSASALLASLTGLVAAALAIYLASAFNSRTLHTVINNVSQLLATVGTALAEISIYLLLLRQSRDSKRGTRPRVPGYQEPVAPVEQDARKPDEVYLGWGSARMVSEHGAWSDSSEDSRTSPPAAGILKTVSVDVVVDVQAEDQWHDAQKEQDPRDWEAVLRQGPK
ncbi:hypothetical protein ACHAQA_003690 [Verticillium albo-atrum]